MRAGMGGEPYYYIVPFDGGPASALEALRQREFRAGRYNPVLDFPMEASDASPGAQHASIDEARGAAGEAGTRSILDIVDIADAPDYCSASPVDAEDLLEYCGTTTPSREVVERQLSELLTNIERGMAAFVVLYEGEYPTEILFIGYSYD